MDGTDDVPSLIPASDNGVPTTAPTAPLVKVPLTIVTGFLGAGKTTLLAGILRQEHGLRVAVVQNERGQALGAEKALTISNGDTQEWIELANGCVCCAVKDDLLLTLEQLLRRSTAEQRPFHHVIIETSGLADPAPLLEIFWVDSALESEVYLDAVVTVCDARHISEHIRDTVEAQQQLAFADRVLLNKCDLADDDTLARAELDIARINGTAVVVRTSYSAVPLERLVGIRAFDPQRAALAAAAAAASHGLVREPSRHTSDICTLNVSVAGWLDKGRLQDMLSRVLWSDAPVCDVLRMKGVVCVRGKPCKYSLQCVRQTWALEKTPLAAPAADAEGGSEFVVIGRRVELVDWKRQFEQCRATTK